MDDSTKATNRNLSTSIRAELSVQSDTLSLSTAEQSEHDEHDTDETMRSEHADSDTSDDDIDSLNYYNTSLQHLTEGFDRICKRNAMLKKRLVDSEKNHRLKVKNLEEAHTKLMDEYIQLEIGMESRIEALKETHDQEMAQLKEEYQRQIEQQKMAMQQSKRLVEEAKNLLQFE